MFAARHVSSAFGLSTVLLLATACQKPEPPKLEPESAAVESIDDKGLTLNVTLDAHNKNSVPLVARSVKAKVVLGGRVDLGEVEVSTKIKLPANKHTKLEVPLTMKWKDVAAIGLMAATKPSIPFVVTGTAEIGSDDVSFDVPFETEGELTRDQLVVITSKALPKLPF